MAFHGNVNINNFAAQLSQVGYELGLKGDQGFYGTFIVRWMLNSGAWEHDPPTMQLYLLPYYVCLLWVFMEFIANIVSVPPYISYLFVVSNTSCHAKVLSVTTGVVGTKCLKLQY